MTSDMFKQICRTCLNTNGEMVSIFSAESHVNQLPKKLMAFTKVEISDNDPLPKTICKKCLFMVESCYCFKEQCDDAYNELKKTLISKNLSKKEDAASKEENKVDLTCSSNKTGVLSLDNKISKKANLGIRNVQNETKNLVKLCQETEDNFHVEYISAAVKTEVENAWKRRQEIERRINMAKVSERVKDLKGIEVVPIGDVKGTRNEGNSKIRKDEIVVFPVQVSEKRCKIIDIIVIDDPPPLNKRPKILPETTVSKVDGDDAEGDDSIVYGTCRKLNFSTVRKVVKIDNDEICTEIKQGDNAQIKYDTDVIVVSDNNDEHNIQFQYSKILNDKKGSEINSEKQDTDVFDYKFQQDSDDDEKNPKTQLFQLSDVVSNCRENISVERNSSKNEKKCTYHPSTIEDKIKKILPDQESKETQRQVDNNLPNCDIVEKATIGSIINGIKEQNFDDINQTDDREGASNFKHMNSGPKKFVDYRADKSNEVFIENHGDIGMKNICLYTKNCTEYKRIEEQSSVSIPDDKKENTDDGLGSSDQATPLASLSVNSSGEENRTINLKIYQRNDDSEKIEELREDDSSGGNENTVPFVHHYSINPNLNFYQCTICSSHFVSIPDMLKHNIQEHMVDKSPLFCLICDKSYKDKCSLCEHVEEHNESKSFKCTVCLKTFTLKRNLRRHIDQHINYKPFECSICKKRFTENASLKSHMYLHTGKSPFACKSCNVSFTSKRNWTRHIMTIHEKVNVVSCNICNKQLSDKRSLQVHTRVHTGDRPYQCPHCGKKFTQKSNLNTHVRRHLNDRPFTCPHCGKGFNQRGTRDDHISTHTGEKPHRCTECDAGFTVSSALKRHMWIHTDKNRPYNCDKCKLQFVGLYDLRRHLKIRHGEAVKPKNPRVRRVAKDDKNKQDECSDITSSVSK